MVLARKVFGGAARVHDAVTQASYALGSVMLLLITLSYIFEVVARYFFNAPTRWAADFVGYALLASIFLLLPYVTANRRHVAVSLVPERLNDDAERALLRVVDLIGAVSCSIAAYFSLLENIRQATNNVLTVGNEPIPKYLISSFITYGLIMAALHFLRHFLHPPIKPQPESGSY